MVRELTESRPLHAALSACYEQRHSDGDLEIRSFSDSIEMGHLAFQGHCRKASASRPVSLLSKAGWQVDRKNLKVVDLEARGGGIVPIHR